MFPHRLVVICASTLLSTICLASEPVELRFKWTKGEQVVYRTVEERFAFNALGVDEGGKDLPVLGGAAVTTTIFRIEPEETRPSGATFLCITTESIRKESTLPRAEPRTDLAKQVEAEEVETDEAVRNAFLQTPLTILLSSTGRVQAVEGLDRIFEQLPRREPDEQSALECMYKISLETGWFERLPDRPVSPGDSWSVTHDMPMLQMGSLRTDITYTLREVTVAGEMRLARIDVFRRMAFRPNPDSEGVELLSTDFFDAVGVGHIVFDVDRGRVERSEIQIHSGGGQPTASLGDSTPAPRRVTRAVRERIPPEAPDARP